MLSIAPLLLFMINLASMIDEFPVHILPTPLSRSLVLRSSHVLKVSELDIHLYDASGTTPTSFVCPLSNVEKVDHTAPRGVSPGVVSLHCSK